MKKFFIILSSIIIVLFLFVSCAKPNTGLISFKITLLGDGILEKSFENDLDWNYYYVKISNKTNTIFENYFKKGSSIIVENLTAEKGEYTFYVSGIKKNETIVEEILFEGQKTLPISYGENNIDITTRFRTGKINFSLDQNLKNELTKLTLSASSSSEEFLAEKEINFNNDFFLDLYPGVWTFSMNFYLSDNSKYSYVFIFEVQPSQTLSYKITKSDVGIIINSYIGTDLPYISEVKNLTCSYNDINGIYELKWNYDEENTDFKIYSRKASEISWTYEGETKNKIFRLINPSYEYAVNAIKSGKESGLKSISNDKFYLIQDPVISKIDFFANSYEGESDGSVKYFNFDTHVTLKNPENIKNIYLYKNDTKFSDLTKRSDTYYNFFSDYFYLSDSDFSIFENSDYKIVIEKTDGTFYETRNFFIDKMFRKAFIISSPKNNSIVDPDKDVTITWKNSDEKYSKIYFYIQKVSSYKIIFEKTFNTEDIKEDTPEYTITIPKDKFETGEEYLVHIDYSKKYFISRSFLTFYYGEQSVN